jgi:hypothetical protein
MHTLFIIFTTLIHSVYPVSYYSVLVARTIHVLIKLFIPKEELIQENLGGFLQRVVDSHPPNRLLLGESHRTMPLQIFAQSTTNRLGEEEDTNNQVLTSSKSLMNMGWENTRLYCKLIMFQSATRPPACIL